MAISKIDDINLFTNIVWEDDKSAHQWCHDAVDYLKDNGITEFSHLNYGDPSQIEPCINPLRTWTFKDGQHPEIDQFPFIIYTECDYSLPMNQWPRVLVYGLDAIKAAGLPDLYKLGR